jgi:eukaryotic translation initiation factor 2C
MKAGDNNSAFDPALLTRLLDADRHTTVIFGADVGHPLIVSFQGVPSVAAVVVSYDNQFQTYPGSMRLQPGGQEVSIHSFYPR